MNVKKIHKIIKEENQELLNWIWATHTQISLFIQNDAQWIMDAQADGGWDDQSLYTFLKSYSLLRGKKGAILSNGEKGLNGARREFLNSCNNNFKNSIGQNNWVDDVYTKWKGADNSFATWVKDAGGNVANNGQMFMPSAFLKAFWFFQPDQLTMFDTYVCRGLRDEDNGVTATPDNFLRRFSIFHAAQEENRNNALQCFHIAYPYHRRITDKYLWLRGNDNNDVIINNFICGVLQLAKYEDEVLHRG